MRGFFSGILSRNALRVLLILLTVTLSATGCVQEHKCEKGFAYTFNPSGIMIGVRADSDSFAKDDVTFDLYYGVHDIDYDKKYNSDPKSFYLKDGNETVFFGLYICDKAYSLVVVNDMEIPDYKTIDNHYFVNEISEEEAFSDEYGFTMSYWKGLFLKQGMTYNHSEKITVPAELFAKERGSFVIKIIAFCEPAVEGGNYYTSTARSIELDYHTVDENTIQIEFKY